MEDEKWKQRVEEELKSQSTLLVDIHRNLKDGEFTKGIYSTVRQHSQDIDRLNDEQGQTKTDLNRLLSYEKLAKKTIWAAVATVWGWFLALVAYVTSKLWPLVIKALGAYASI